MARGNEGLMHRFVTTLLAMTILFLPLQLHAYSRIISLKPNITEIVFALDEGNKLVGITSFCQRPPEAAKLPKVADYISIDVERVLAQKPDLILASTENASRKEVEFLKAQGIPVELFAFTSLQDIRSSVLRLGTLLGKISQAQALVQEMDRSLGELKDRADKAKPMTALFIVGYDPLVVVGGNNFIGQSFPFLGLRNVAEKSRMSYPVYSMEQLLQSAPELIVDLAMGSEATASKRAQRQSWWQGIPSIPAIREHRIYSFDIEKIRAVPELPQALTELFSLIHAAPSPNS